MDKQIGNYKIEGLVGQGSMGKVFLGRHPILGNEVAIKVLSEDFSSYPELVKRFRREARAIAAIRHAAIVKALDFGDLPDGRSYYVMELLKGQSLQAYMRARGPLPLDEATAIFLPLSEALGVCHAAGFIHRDIKPENVFLTNAEDGSVFPKIIDFGIAKLKHPDGPGDSVVTRLDAVMGTPLYMAPEQGPGIKEDVGPWSDVYSLGATLFHMLAYRPPFYSESPMELIIMHTHRERPGITEIRQDLPEDLDRVIKKAMAVQPSERYQSMAEFSAAYTGAVDVDDSVIAPGALADLAALEGLEGDALEAAIGGKTVVDTGPMLIEKTEEAPADSKASVESEAKDSDEESGIEPAEPSVIVESGLTPAEVEEDRSLMEPDAGDSGGNTGEVEGAKSGVSSTDWDSAAEFIMDAQVAPEIEDEIEQLEKKKRKILFFGLFGFIGAILAAAAIWFFWFYEKVRPIPETPVELSMISSGDSHTCGIEKGTGRVLCWGRNNYGQLGTGSRKNHHKASYTKDLKEVSFVSAGGRHTCVVGKGGDVWCWGKNTMGQLGDGTIEDRQVPVQVLGIQDAVSVHAGAEHTCALRSGGEVMCWGWNKYGQLGDGSENRMSKKPVDVIVGKRLAKLTPGGFHNCGIVKDGGAVCWGRNDEGQLGLGDDANRRKPEALSLEEKVVFISAGGAHTCVVLEGERAACWGRNASGQVGSRRGEMKHIKPVGVVGMENLKSISAGGDYLGGFTCVVDGESKVICWGSNLYGQVGGQDVKNYIEPNPVEGLTDIAAVETGAMHSCALDIRGTAWCWGRNIDGQLGSGGTEDSEKPVVITRN